MGWKDGKKRGDEAPSNDYSALNTSIMAEKIADFFKESATQGSSQWIKNNAKLLTMLPGASSVSHRLIDQLNTIYDNKYGTQAEEMPSPPKKDFNETMRLIMSQVANNPELRQRMQEAIEKKKR